MKLLKTLLVCAGVLSLFACNMGDNVGTDVQTNSFTGGNGSNQWRLGYTATGCRTIASVNGSCNVQISYSGTGTFSGQTPVITGLNGYTNTANTQCTYPSSSSSYNNPCTATINVNGANVNNAQTAIINLSTGSISFTVGGGLN